MRIIHGFMQFYEKRKRLLREEGLLPYLLNQSGYVLIIVLIITTLLVAVAGEFIVVAQTNIGYGQNLKNKLKASYLAKSGIQLAQFILYADLKGVNAEMLTGKTTFKDVDSYNDIWAIDFPTLPISDGSLKLQIIDENSKINLSVLANEFTEMTKYYYFTQIFFMNMGFSLDIPDAIHDWVDIDDSRMPYGAESPEYQTLTPPYQAQNNAMDSIDEMLLIKGMTPAIFYGFSGGNTEAEKREPNIVENNKGNVGLDLDKIAEMAGEAEAKRTKESQKEKGKEAHDNVNLIPIGKEKSRVLSDYFTVYGDRENYLGDNNKININTASYRVLSALTDKMTPDIVTEIIRRRLIQPYKDVAEIKDLITDEKVRERLSVKSAIFKIVSTATIENVQVKITVYYNRNMRILFYWSEE